MTKWIVSFDCGEDSQYSRFYLSDSTMTEKDICEAIRKECEEKWICLNGLVGLEIADVKPYVNVETVFIKSDKIISFYVVKTQRN